ncbi:cytochrome P450 [Lineolata rhizophorae]|uniref:Cytochrome P450 n=1 Tax=Lineolata rhizophorae TaxID=578093 RepID=A0A6A6NU35_9PEZI|nr:cytochrome P450 [Lineolata rhizophorae]
MIALWIAIVSVVAYILHSWRCLARNIAAAKRSGLPYVVQPIYTFNRAWLVTHRIWLPLLRKLPSAWTCPWIEFLDPDWPWSIKFNPFEQLGCDVFLAVSPKKCAAFVGSPEAINQITARRNDFPKPVWLYKNIDVYGKNVVSSEGMVWRQHRKITSPSFSERNNGLVWEETVHQVQSMIAGWIGKGPVGAKTIQSPAADAMRATLHIISRAGFGVRLLWPHEESGLDRCSVKRDGYTSTNTPSPGHSMSYSHAMTQLLENVMWIPVLPLWFLARSPFRVHRLAHEACVEWGKYMVDLYQTKKNQLYCGDAEATGGMDILGAMIRGSGLKPEHSRPNNSQKSQTSEGQMLSDSEILGNAFVITLAGHETTSNTIHFSLLLLALNWDSQERLQKDIDRILEGRPVEEWSYEQDFPKLFAGMPGAVMNEELRLIPPILLIPKSTPDDAPQALTVDGKQIVIPAGSDVSLCPMALHRNRKFWPSQPDLDYFRPDRWFVKPAYGLSESPSSDDLTPNAEPEELKPSNGSDVPRSHYQPVKGAFAPFSQGHRSCIGRRFAQVEVVASLAVIFRDYSVELAVDEFASDEEVAKMPPGGAERRRVWQMAAGRAEDLLKNNMSSIITLQMRGAHVPLRLVRRGEERFVFR